MSHKKAIFQLNFFLSSARTAIWVEQSDRQKSRSDLVRDAISVAQNLCKNSAEWKANCMMILHDSRDRWHQGVVVRISHKEIPRTAWFIVIIISIICAQCFNILGGIAICIHIALICNLNVTLEPVSCKFEFLTFRERKLSYKLPAWWSSNIEMLCPHSHRQPAKRDK